MLVPVNEIAAHGSRQSAGPAVRRALFDRQRQAARFAGAERSVRIELALFAGRFLGFLDDIQVPLEPGMKRQDAHALLLEAMLKESAPSSTMVDVIDEHYRFVGEEDA